MIRAKITWQHMIVSFIVFILFLIFVLPSEAQRSSEYYGDAATPDTSLFYNANTLHEMAHEMGEVGRRYYIQSRLTFDVIWPLVYGFFLWTGIAFWGGLLNLSYKNRLLWLPLLSVAFDYLENIGASVVMFFYPTQVVLLPKVVPFFTLLKWFTISTCFFLLFILIGVYLYKKLISKN